MAQPIVAKQAADSPLMAHIRLQNVILPGAKELKFKGNAIPLLESPTETALYARLPRASGDVLVLSVSLADGDLPLRIAFPVMIKNAIESFLGGKGELRPALATGQITSIPSQIKQPSATDLAQEMAKAETAQTVGGSQTSATRIAVSRGGFGTARGIGRSVERGAVRSGGSMVGGIEIRNRNAGRSGFDER